MLDLPSAGVPRRVFHTYDYAPASATHGTSRADVRRAWRGPVSFHERRGGSAGASDGGSDDACGIGGGGGDRSGGGDGGDDGVLVDVAPATLHAPAYRRTAAAGRLRRLLELHHLASSVLQTTWRPPCKNPGLHIYVPNSRSLWSAKRLSCTMPLSCFLRPLGLPSLPACPCSQS
eukprot:5827125-Pleurochrysis_carterae.AAC.4